mgnify:CR=1 FL=1
MAMMQYMRGAVAKWVLYLLIFAFVGLIIFEWGMDFTGLRSNPNVAAKVNGEEISREVYGRAYEATYQNYSARFGAEYAEKQLKQIEDQAFNDLVRNVLIRQEVEKRNLTVSPDEMFYYTYHNPPEEIKRDSTFMNEQGQFDLARYQAAIQSGVNEQAMQFLEFQLSQSIPTQKLADEISSTIFVTDSEVREEYLRQNQKATVEYLFVNSSRFANEEIEVTDAELQAKYDERKDSFKQQERKKIEFVRFSTSPTADDSASTKELIEDLLQRARSGVDFGELARDFSDDNTNSEQGGDLGFFPKEKMVASFSEAAFNASVGDIVGPVETQFGLHIIKVNDRKEEDGVPQVSAQHILRNFTASTKTKDAASDSADFFASNAQDESWEAALGVDNLTAQSTAFFQEASGFIPGLGPASRVSNFVFRNEVDAVSDPIQTDQGWIVARITERQPERTQTLDEVRATLENQIKRDKRNASAANFADGLLQKLNEGLSLAEIAEQDSSLTFEAPEAFTRNGYIRNVGRDAAFIGTAFSLNVGETSGSIEGNNGGYILKLTAKDEFNPAEYAARKEGIRTSLRQQKEQRVFEAWLADLRERAEIEDLRYNFL